MNEEKAGLSIIKLLENSASDTAWSKKEISRKCLINALNYANFKGAKINVSFKHIKNNNVRIYSVSPHPCHSEFLSAAWDEKVNLDLLLQSYRFTYLLIPNGRKMILSKPELLEVNETGIKFSLPETSSEINNRSVKRHPVADVSATIMYNNTLFEGTLLDFSANSFRAEIILRESKPDYWIANQTKAQVILKKGYDAVFSGECSIVRQTATSKGKILVLKPSQAPSNLFKPKIFRSARVKLTPAPRFVSRHPLINKMVTLEIIDIAGPGFSVEECKENSVLFPGLILPDVQVEFAPGFSISCVARVVHQESDIDGQNIGVARSGLAILDMSIGDQARLFSVLQSVDRHSFACNRVELDELWELFFDTGFIYPEKYMSIHENKHKLMASYEKLYNQDSDIARHFIYRERSKILGHLSMIRLYENSWLIHHHAARKTNIRAGLNVLHQVGAYINDFNCFHSTHMDYVMCYFRPENKFPYRVFGGCSKAINNPKGCSLDSFAYLKVEKDPRAAVPVNALPLELQKEDFEEFRCQYEEASGGLAIKAMELTFGSSFDSLKKAYAKAGLKREKIVKGIKKNGLLRAVIIVNTSDIGLNFSDLTNSIHVFVLDKTLPFNELMNSLQLFASHFEEDHMTTLIHPVEYMQDMNTPGADRFYNLWVLNMSHTDEYFDFINRLLNGTQKESSQG